MTDTVGFISDLPKELVNAFRATLEELGASSLLLHVADASDPMVEERIESVQKILENTGYDGIKELIVLNKEDKAPKDEARRLSKIYNAPLISAKDKKALSLVTDLIEKEIFTDLEVTSAGSNLELSLNTV